MGWDKLPHNLRYLAEPAAEYGALQFDDRIYAFLEDQMSDNERELLHQLNQSYIRDEAAIDAFLDTYPMTVHPEARLVYFLGHMLALANEKGLLIDELGIQQTKVEETDPVAQLISDLEQFGSTRNDSDRMWAARMLPDHGDDAKRAIPSLEKALNDPVPSVRVWAHVAVARLVGDEDKHRKAIWEIGRRSEAELDCDSEREMLQLDVKAALDVLGTP